MMMMTFVTKWMEVSEDSAAPSPLLSRAYYVTNGPHTAGTTPSRPPTSTRGADAWRRIALKLSTT